MNLGVIHVSRRCWIADERRSDRRGDADTCTTRRRPGDKTCRREEIAPPENHMREHGVLNRMLVVYEEAIRRNDGSRPGDGRTACGDPG